MATENFEREAQFASVKESGELSQTLEALPVSFEGVSSNEQSADVPILENVTAPIGHSFFGNSSSAGPDGSVNTRSIGYVPFLVGGIGLLTSVALAVAGQWQIAIPLAIASVIGAWFTRKSKA